jgi:hypothetical protein
MENLTLHRAPSVGRVVKRMLDINPALGTPQLIELIRQATLVRGPGGLGFAEVETVDEEEALRLARATLDR